MRLNIAKCDQLSRFFTMLIEDFSIKSRVASDKACAQRRDGMETTDSPATFTREDVSFDVHGTRVEAWFYRPDETIWGSGPHPCIVIGHGMGGVRRVRLPQYAARFAEAGMACVVFDYRHFGDSAGEPRQLFSIRKQQQDYEAAIAYAKSRTEVDSARIALWGTSFAGGHVMVLAARHAEIAAVVAQCPYTSGVGDGVKKRSPLRVLRFIATGLLDEVGSWFGAPAITIPIFGKPGDFAVLTSPNAIKGYEELRKLLDPSIKWRQYLTARFVLHIPFYSPLKHAPQVRCPMLVCVCDKDRDVDPSGAHDAAKAAPQGHSIGYRVEHFEIYLGDNFERVVSDQTAFFVEQLKPARLS